MVAIVLLIILVLMYCFLTAIFSAFAYFEGRDDATRYYGSYSNTFWMPAAYFYELGYSKWKGKDRSTLKERNAKRFNRK